MRLVFQQYVSMKSHRRVHSISLKLEIPWIQICSQTAILTQDFRGFPQPIQANVGKASQIRARQFAFTFSLIHSSHISYHSTPYIVRLKYFVKETTNNFQSMITAAYPQRQTRPAERKTTKKYNEDSSLLRYCAVSTG